MITVHHWLESKLPLLHFPLVQIPALIRRLKPKARRRKVRYTVKDHRRLRAAYVTHLANGDHRFSVDAYGRVHTLLTSLENDLLPAVQVNVNGKLEPLVEIDVVNSQPLGLCMLARQFVSCGKDARKRLVDRSFSVSNCRNTYLQSNQSINQSITLTNNKHKPVLQPDTEFLNSVNG
jgi:hypothetical protein